MEKFTYYLEMAQSARFSSGAFGDKHGARKLVQAFKKGKETYDMPNGDKYKLTKKVSSLDLTRGMIVLASYDATNQGAQVYEIKNIIDSEHKEGHKSVKDMLKKHGVTKLGALEDKEPRLVVKDLEDGEEGDWFYEYKGAWVRGSGAERLSFRQVEKV